MKRETIVVLVSILFLGIMGGLLGVRSAMLVTVEEQEQELAIRQGEIVKLEERINELEADLAIVPYTHPLQGGVVTSGTGYRLDPMGGGDEALHQGYDLSALTGTPVRAALAGVVAEHWPAPDGYFKGHPIFGGLVVLDHGNGLFSRYGHLSVSYVQGGDRVGEGDIIGLVGSTGISTGPHLHFDIVVDPFLFLSRRRYADE